MATKTLLGGTFPGYKMAILLMAKTSPQMKKQRVVINPIIAANAEKLAAKRGQQLFELVNSLLERELRSCGVDPFATEEPAAEKSAGHRKS